ncbi:MAG: hypothetical protein H0W96_15590 [Solirubrobacterales bacterium]|nr:hypothetical protein [Solirubrobacterales bacterium]
MTIDETQPRRRPTAGAIDAEVRGAVADALELAAGNNRADQDLAGDLGMGLIGGLPYRCSTRSR